jgi:hypothetical protein
MPLSHAKLWKAVDALARREGLSPSGLARRAGLDATSFNPSKRFGAGDPPRPRWPSTESMTLMLQATGVSLAEFAALADDAPPTSTTVPLLGLARAGLDGFFDDAGLPVGLEVTPDADAVLGVNTPEDLGAWMRSYAYWNQASRPGGSTFVIIYTPKPPAWQRVRHAGHASHLHLHLPGCCASLSACS